jgi:hypothetical protein
MAITTCISQKLAEQALEAVKKQFSVYVSPGYEPKLVQNWEKPWNGETIDWVIVWEDGAPFEWAVNARDGGYDEELSSLMEKRVETPAATEWPEGVCSEAATYYVLALYPQD